MESDVRSSTSVSNLGIHICIAQTKFVDAAMVEDITPKPQNVRIAKTFHNEVKMSIISRK